MVPIRDDNPSPRFPLIVVFLILANAYVFYHGWSLGPLEEAFVNKWGLIPARDLTTQLNLLNFFSSMFLHGGVLHLALNMWTFWIFGDNVEGAMGPVKFLLFYLACGFMAAFAHAWLEPASALPVVGASGAIAGVMGGYMFLFPRARIRMFTLLIFYPLFFDLPAWAFLIFWFIGQVMSGAQTLATPAGQADVGGIAFFAHIGGFLAGLVLVPLFASSNRRRTRKTASTRN